MTIGMRMACGQRDIDISEYTMSEWTYLRESAKFPRGADFCRKRHPSSLRAFFKELQDTLNVFSMT